MRKVYLIGSLRNPNVQLIAKELQSAMPDVRIFDDWACAGEHADDAWRDHEQGVGVSLIEALQRPAAQHVFAFDKKHLEESTAVVLIAPAGKSAHLELGWCLGKGKPGYILIDNPERWDVMMNFADGVTQDIWELVAWLRGDIVNADNP